MSLPDHLVEPDEEDYCDIHEMFFVGRCQECVEDGIETAMEWAMEKVSLHL